MFFFNYESHSKLHAAHLNGDHVTLVDYLLSEATNLQDCHPFIVELIKMCLKKNPQERPTILKAQPENVQNLTKLCEVLRFTSDNAQRSDLIVFVAPFLKAHLSKKVIDPVVLEILSRFMIHAMQFKLFRCRKVAEITEMSVVPAELVTEYEIGPEPLGMV